jgi:hypothetical protein
MQLGSYKYKKKYAYYKEYDANIFLNKINLRATGYIVCGYMHRHI